uniref:Uncharacterized protein n=1 Tax=Chromera velia CCMP2878 TaxID=1169474 RepID=A0A0G4GB75_9ALVE|eukprot:Cvel_21105.t1-p1 / transcript=Cvel_21105.t1 / gene=Cvel_21105 / organism=Chromera_velia_CCMP2878 / gene_product=hypothetical protein / transcript_product=hypothetical protein / location=Cvel_scaffold1952:19081-19290(+) / protein_length=70 / sequence_SO=supercontig / SO=protein_coding / is_pseudo=false
MSGASLLSVFAPGPAKKQKTAKEANRTREMFEKGKTEVRDAVKKLVVYKEDAEKVLLLGEDKYVLQLSVV